MLEGKWSLIKLGTKEERKKGNEEERKREGVNKAWEREREREREGVRVRNRRKWNVWREKRKKRCLVFCKYERNMRGKICY